MLRAAVLALVIATPVLAEDSREVSCGYQGAVAGAIQKARLGKVKKEDVEKTILGSNPPWPEAYNNAIPHLTEFVYAPTIKLRDLRRIDLARTFEEQCIQNWEDIQRMKQNIKN